MIVVDSATHTQKDDVEVNGGSLEDGAKIFVLFLRGAQLALRSSVLTVLDLDKVDVTLRMLRSLDRCCLGKVDLLVAGGTAEVLPVPLSCPLPLLRTTLLHSCVGVLHRSRGDEITNSLLRG